MAEFLFKNVWPFIAFHIALILAFGIWVVKQVRTLDRIGVSLINTTEELKTTREHYHDIANNMQIIASDLHEKINNTRTGFYEKIEQTRTEFFEKIDVVKDGFHNKLFDFNKDVGELRVKIGKLEK